MYRISGSRGGFNGQGIPGWATALAYASTRDGRRVNGVNTRRIHVIIGPTSTGKTERSVELAKSLQAPVIAMDRIQIYDDLAITSGRPSELELHGTTRLYLDHRLATADREEMPAATALEKLRWLLAQIEGDVILEGG